jgi:hypothetical protein
MAIYAVSLPPSVNNLYVTIGRKRCKASSYKTWIKGKMKALLAQRARPVPPPVSLDFTFPNSMRGDIEGRLKAAIDLLVRAGIIPDDNKKVVRQIAVNFADIDGMRVCIQSIASATTSKD